MIVGGVHPSDVFDAAGDPCVAVAENTLGGVTYQILRWLPENSFCGFVHLDDDELLVECDDSIRERFQDALVVVFESQHIGEQSGILKRNGNIGRECLQPANVDFFERSSALVQYLDEPQTFAGTVDYWHVEEVARAKSRDPIDFWIEARVGVGVWHIKYLAAGKRRTGDASARRYPDRSRPHAFCDLRPKLVCGGVVEKKRRAFGIQEVSCCLHNAREEVVKMELRRERLRYRQQLNLFASNTLETFRQLSLLEGVCGMAIDRVQKRHVEFGKAPGPLIQYLGHAEDLTSATAQRHAENVARTIPGLLVDPSVEARILVRVIYNFRQ